MKNNHYIHAAWTGMFWSEKHYKLISPKEARCEKIYFFKIGEVLENKKNKEWPTLEQLLDYKDAEKVFKSNHILPDEIDDDFACETEKCLAEIVYIHDVIDNDLSKFKNNKSKIFQQNIAVDDVIHSKFINYLVMHGIRNKLLPRQLFSNIDEYYKNHIEKLPIQFVSENFLNILEEEKNSYLLYLKNKDFNLLYKIRLKLLRQMTADEFELISKEILTYKYVNYTSSYIKETQSYQEINLLTEIPFLLDRHLLPDRKLDIISRFLEYLKKPENISIVKDLDTNYGGSYLDSHIFSLELNTALNNFFYGPLSKQISVFGTKYDIYQAKYLKDFFANTIYDESATQNSLNHLVLPTKNEAENVYNYLIQTPFLHMQKNYYQMKEILKKPN